MNKTKEPYWVENQPNVPRVWSASSLSTILACPRRFELRYIEGWEKAESAALAFGKEFHRVLEACDLAAETGASPEETRRVAVRESLKAFLPPGDNSRTNFTLLRATLFYLDHYKDDPYKIIQVNDKPAIELYFRFALDLTNADGENYYIQGYMDEFRDLSGDLFVWERKTTAKSLSDYYFNQFDPNIQMGIYTVGAQILAHKSFAGVVLDVTQTLVGSTNFTRRWIKLSEEQLDETLENALSAIRLAERCAQANYWPQNTSACGICDFKDVCNKQPKVRHQWLKSGFLENRRETTEQRK